MIQHVKLNLVKLQLALKLVYRLQRQRRANNNINHNSSEADLCKDIILSCVTRRRDRLVLGWVTGPRINFRCRTYLSITSHTAGQLSPAIPPWVGAMSTSQRQ